jgi:hypothetical protein
MKHIYSSFTKLLVSIFVWLLAIISANAQWSTQSNVNNPICISTGGQDNSAVVSDGSGGAIITWVDTRTFATSDYDIYAQRIDANGTVLWTTNGVAVCTATNSQLIPAITSDGSGGAIITWRDDRNIATTSNDIYAQRIDASGVVQWTPNGVAISTATNFQSKPVVVSDGNGGAIISWWDGRGGNDIYAQRINASGIVQWTTNGVLLTSVVYLSDQQFPTIASDGAGGAIIAWVESVNTIGTTQDIYTQRIDGSGNIKWTVNGVAVCAATGGQGGDYSPRIVSDGSGGAVITWDDYRSGSSPDLYAQRINAGGVIQWTVNGVTICTEAHGQSYPVIGSDGNGGGIIAWQDNRNNASTGYDLYAQRIDGTGSIQWTTDGVVISNQAGTQGNPRGCPVISDGNGGAIIIWDSSIGSNLDIYGQRINASGVVQWVANGVIISNATSSQNYSSATSDGKGGAIIAWNDFRSGSDIYAQQINTNGILGNIITGVKEQPSMIPNLNLQQNYPNPFKQSTLIKYEIGIREMVSLKVYDLFGKEIKILVNEEKAAGNYEVNFDTSQLPPGNYFYKLQAGSSIETKKMILMK